MSVRINKLPKLRKWSQKQIDNWNAKHPKGSRCWVTFDDGSEHPLKTESVAWLIGGRHAVVKVTGISGGYALERVRPELVTNSVPIKNSETTTHNINNLQTPTADS